MSAKKWIAMFFAAVLLALLTVAGLNMLADPFGVFGDRLLHWYSYNETNNPRAAKIAYLEQYGSRYDSFIIGSSSAASYNPEELNEYLDARFYNLFVYGCDTADYRLYAEYVIERFGAKNLVLNLGINETNAWNSAHDTPDTQNHAAVTGQNKLLFYLNYAFCNPKYSFEKLRSRWKDTELPQVFDVFLEDTGCYDKRVRDVEKIGDMDVYLRDHGESFGACESQMTYWRECVESVAYIKRLCDEHGVRLFVICSPVYESQWAACDRDTMTQYKKALAETVDYWDFSHTSISADSRYFYDKTHFRNAVGSMVLAKIFGAEDVYLPEDFGLHVTRENVNACVEALYAARNNPSAYTADVPVLMYHHMADEGNGGTIISTDGFAHQMQLLSEAGYQTVTMQQLLDYVYQGKPLPENPVCITMDDGYASNYEIAYPILKRYGMTATIFPIGVSVGKDTYKDTDHAITPHFGWDAANEMIASGVMDVQSHSYDMHQWEPFEASTPCRSGIRPFDGESEEAFIAALTDDLHIYSELYAENCTGTLCALAYPMGQYSTLTEAVIHESGIPITFSTQTDRRNVLVKGLPQSLYALCRLSMNDDISDEALLAYLEGTR